MKVKKKIYKVFFFFSPFLETSFPTFRPPSKICTGCSIGMSVSSRSFPRLLLSWSPLVGSHGLPILLTHFAEAHGTWEESFRISENIFAPSSQLISGLAAVLDVFCLPLQNHSPPFSTLALPPRRLSLRNDINWLPCLLVSA